ncbi:MAG TPA: amidohydrolase family protein [Steroidobacteraceae bacterium]|jgi:predicted amidohydrolase YtcJ|nr:amidohydrolase family protein [Steroidobacteraceae bacterium]
MSPPAPPLLIRNAELDGRRTDVAVAGGRIVDIRPGSQGPSDLTRGGVIDAAGGVLLPGLHDHHLHLFGLAAARHSIGCGPPDVPTARALRETLERAAGGPAVSWLRGVGYHESVAGDIDRDWLDDVVPHRPIRIQHRSGRLWILNSRALALLPASQAGPLERREGRLTGRLYDADPWLRQQLRSDFPPLADVCRELASYGITGLTDASVSNGCTSFAHLAGLASDGVIPQTLSIMGDATLSGIEGSERVAVGAFKLHLHEHALPELSSTARDVAAAHDAGRVAAFHCVTQAELVYALAVLDEAGPVAGDRLEHAAMVSPDLMHEVARRGLTVVTQPHFILERGDQYHRDIPVSEHGWLYRCASWHRMGVPLAAGSDAPYGSTNPWIAMQAAVERRTREGRPLGDSEALQPEQALALYLTPLQNPAREPRRLQPGAAADLCLLDRPWRVARNDLSAVRVSATVCQGRIVAAGKNVRRAQE